MRNKIFLKWKINDDGSVENAKCPGVGADVKWNYQLIDDGSATFPESLAVPQNKGQNAAIELACDEYCSPCS